jgi:hypothetical protein
LKHDLLDEMLQELDISTVGHVTMFDQLQALKNRDGWQTVGDRHVQAAAGSMLQLAWYGVPFATVRLCPCTAEFASVLLCSTVVCIRV